MGRSKCAHRDMKRKWLCGEGTTLNQVDHVLIDFSHKSTLCGIICYREANIDSGHYLTLLTFVIKIVGSYKVTLRRVMFKVKLGSKLSDVFILKD